MALRTDSAPTAARVDPTPERGPPLTMTYRPDLSPAQHVARREALAQIARGDDLLKGIDVLADAIVKPLALQFFKGDRLERAEFEALVDRIRGILVPYGSPVMVERRKGPTRARPKGEEHEFLCAMRCSDSPGNGGYELVGMRVFASRRRLTYECDPNGVRITRHALERSIERGLASWTGRLAEVEDAMLDNLGLVAVWRHAVETGRTPNLSLALPCGGGLILGAFVHTHTKRRSAGMAIARNRCESLVRDGSPLVSHPSMAAAATSVDAALRTAVDEDLLTIGQVDLRDALGRFRRMHQGFMEEFLPACLWPTASIEPSRPPAEIASMLDALADELVGLLGRPGAQEALRGKRGDPGLGGVEAEGSGEALPA